MDIVNHANNHAFDYGAVGWRSTRDALTRAKVEATGAPGELDGHPAPRHKVAFLGFCTYSWTNAMGDDAAVRARVQSAAGRPTSWSRSCTPGAEGADKQHVPRGPESAFGEYRGNSRALRARRRSTRAPTSCSARARTSCAGWSSTRTA